MATLASLTVNLLAQTSRFTQPIRAAARTVQQFDRQADRMQNTLRQVEGATSSARTRLLAMTAALTVATKQATEYADSILAVHRQTGLAVESTQALRYAASQSHTDIATFEKGMRSFVRRAAEAAAGNISMAKGFDVLGVSVVDSEGRLKDTEALLMEVADGAARMGTEAEASAALMRVMGDAGRRLVPFMRQGSAGIRALMDEAERMGLIMDENAIATLGALGDQAALTSNRIGAMSRDMAYRFAPAVQVVLGWVNQLINGFFDLSAEQRQNIVRWSAYIGMVLGAVAAIGVLARVLTAGIGILRAFSMALSFVFSPMVLYIALALAAIAAFKIAWETDWKGIRTAVTTAWEQYIRPVWENMKTWVVNRAGDAWEWLTTTTWAEKWADVKGWLTDGWRWLVTLGGSAWVWLQNTDWAAHWKVVMGWLTAGWRWTIERFGDAWEWLDGHAPWVTDTLRELYDLINKGWTWAIDTGGAVWDWIKNLVPGEIVDLGKARLRLTIDAFGGLYDAIKTGLETGDWSGVWGATAGAWREGIKIAVTLMLASGAIQGLMSAISTGLGLVGAGAAGLSALGLPGVLGAISIGVALMEAIEHGGFKAFGANLIAALAAGIGIGMFTGSPYAGALAFTIVLNFRIGEWIGDRVNSLMESDFMRGVRGRLGTGPTREGELLLNPQYYGDREAYLQPVPKYGFWDRARIWWMNRGFQEGTPWTGWGPLDEVAGVVHRREAVIPWSALQKGPAGVLDFLGVPGFQDGRGEGFLRGALESARPALEALRPGLTDSLIDALEMLGQGVDLVREHVDELMRAIENGPQAIDDAINSVREFSEETEQAAKRQAALDGLLAELIGRLPELNRVLQGIDAGAVFGPTGSLIGAFAALTMESETVGRAFRMINEALGALADAAGMLLQPLLPLIYVLQSVLVPIFGVLGAVLEAVLLPIMPFVFESFKFVGIAVLFVAEVFQRARAFILDAVGGLVWGIGKFVDSLVGWVTSVGRNLMAAGDTMRRSAEDARKSADDMARQRQELADLTYEEAMARAKHTDEIERAIGGMINIPQGFRYALARMDAATPRAMPAHVTPAPSATVHPRPGLDVYSGVGLSGSGVQYVIHGDVYGWDDFKRKVQRANAESKRDGNLATYGFGGAT